jgi:hypothetical protein
LNICAFDISHNRHVCHPSILHNAAALMFSWLFSMVSAFMKIRVFAHLPWLNFSTIHFCLTHFDVHLYSFQWSHKLIIVSSTAATRSNYSQFPSLASFPWLSHFLLNF